MIYNDPKNVPYRELYYLWTVVVDLDDTLVVTTHNTIHIRPYVGEFLRSVTSLKAQISPSSRFVYPAVEVILWSAGDASHVEECLAHINSSGDAFDYIVCRGDWAHSDDGIVRKNLDLLPGRASSSILIDDLPFASLLCGYRLLLVPVFKPKNAANDIAFLWIKELVTIVTYALAAERIDRAYSFPETAKGLEKEVADTAVRSPATPSMTRSMKHTVALIQATAEEHASGPVISDYLSEGDKPSSQKARRRLCITGAGRENETAPSIIAKYVTGVLRIAAKNSSVKQEARRSFEEATLFYFGSLRRDKKAIVAFARVLEFSGDNYSELGPILSLVYACHLISPSFRLRISRKEYLVAVLNRAIKDYHPDVKKFAKLCA